MTKIRSSAGLDQLSLTRKKIRKKEKEKETLEESHYGMDEVLVC